MKSDSYSKLNTKCVNNAGNELYQLSIRTLLVSLIMLWIPCNLSAQPAADPQTAMILEALNKYGVVKLGRTGVEVRVFDHEIDGLRLEALRFATSGEGQRGGVLLVPGFGRGARDYLPLGIRCAIAGFVCVAVSQPGFGGSEGVPDFAGPSTVAALRTMLHALRDDSGVDPARVAAFGYSRGALAVASLAVESSLLAAVVLGGGIYDFQSAYDSIEFENIRANMEAEAGLDVTSVAQRSPLQQASSIESPTLIIHGEDDRNAPVSQAIALHQALQSAGTQVELVIIPQQGHTLPLDELASRMMTFLSKHLSQR